MTDTTQVVKSKSGYHNLESDRGVGTVKSDLIADDAIKMQWLKVDFSRTAFKKYYGLEKKLKDKYRVAVGSDYMFLNQIASFSYSDRWDTRVEQGTEARKGWCFSASRRFGSYIPFLRAGITNGNTALMHHLVMAGVGIDAFRGDNLGIGLNWGGPSDRTRRDQYSLELYYAIQLTQHLNIMPDIQLTMNPSFNNTRDLVAVFSTIRIRYAM